MLHKYSRFVVACTVLLILAGSFVTSTDSGLSVPDWPTTYGQNMFTFPYSKMVGGIFYEHGHRLIASTVGFLTIGLVVWLWLADSRRWLKWFGVAALGSIVAQGVLGGLTVLFFLPPAVSTAHAGLAEIFFCMTVAIAIFTSPGWMTTDGVDDSTLRTITTTTTILIYTQILIGATMRHTGAGLAIPDFPWMFGHVIPDHWSAKIAVHFAHRAGALVVTCAVVGSSIYIWRTHGDRPELARPATLILFLVGTQIMLGAFTVLSKRDVWINSLHVVCGALVLTTSLVITLRAWKSRIADRGLRNADLLTINRQSIRNPQSSIRTTGAA
ncbi:MAG TPA: COX15/CtaA family protein [Vicinamibacterales bacterium]|nr:COX15/CtaA family protein [Vicinamibacterales bacterium]